MNRLSSIEMVRSLSDIKFIRPISNLLVVSIAIFTAHKFLRLFISLNEKKNRLFC